VDATEAQAHLQAILDRACADGAGLYVTSPDLEDGLYFLVSKMVCTHARPIVGAGGDVDGWRYIVAWVPPDAFVDGEADWTIRARDVIVSRWYRNAKGEVYALEMRTPDGEVLTVNPLDEDDQARVYVAFWREANADVAEETDAIVARKTLGLLIAAGVVPLPPDETVEPRGGGFRLKWTLQFRQLEDRMTEEPAALWVLAPDAKEFRIAVVTVDPEWREWGPRQEAAFVQGNPKPWDVPDEFLEYRVETRGQKAGWFSDIEETDAFPSIEAFVEDWKRKYCSD
jgi:hypothetical protein